MRRTHIFLLAAGLLLLALTSACGDDAASNETSDQPTTEPTPAATPEPVFPEFDAANFGNSAVIDNEWMPLKVGTKWVFDGFITEDEEKIPHSIEFTVTDLTKEVHGVRTAVAWIVDITDGEVVEKEIAFYAQDKDGTVWYFGEHPEEYEEGKLIDSPTWIAGVADSKPGVKMFADPKLGQPSTFQGWGATVEWNDYSFVDDKVDHVCVLGSCYDDILVMAESSLDETGVFQLKSYARGVGEIRVGWRGEPETPEGLQLTSVTQLSPEALAAIRAEALALEAHAYEISPDVYGQTSPSGVAHAAGG